MNLATNINFLNWAWCKKQLDVNFIIGALLLLYEFTSNTPTLEKKPINPKNKEQWKLLFHNFVENLWYVISHIYPHKIHTSFWMDIVFEYKTPVAIEEQKPCFCVT